VSQQTQDTGTNFFGANPNAPPLQLANDSENMQRALRRRAEYTRYLAVVKDNERVRQLIADKRDPDDLCGNLLSKFTVKDDSHYEANDRRWEWREWCTTRWGPLKAHIDMYMTREEFIQ
jgi:hypothetical protein